jgi:hypothetical protein
VPKIIEPAGGITPLSSVRERVGASEVEKEVQDDQIVLRSDSDDRPTSAATARQGRVCVWRSGRHRDGTEGCEEERPRLVVQDVRIRKDSDNVSLSPPLAPGRLSGMRRRGQPDCRERAKAQSGARVAAVRSLWPRSGLACWRHVIPPSAVANWQPSPGDIAIARQWRERRSVTFRDRTTLPRRSSVVKTQSLRDRRSSRRRGMSAIPRRFYRRQAADGTLSRHGLTMVSHTAVNRTLDT